MNIDIAASLNQRQRDALLTYYIGQHVPASSNPDLVSLVQTPEDVYEYLLIDPLVSNAVPTSRVAQAMSSIQQYINGITMNMEPGYTTRSLDPENISNWKDGLSQYDIWAGEVELDTYPENYIDPTLRQSPTTYFKDLITDLNQNTINGDTVQQAVMNYLNKFEQVANLTIVSGYMDGTDQTQSTYYILGKSNTSPVQYYWRSFDMRQNVDNIVSTGAWSEWFPMNTAINEDALQSIPRLVYFNNRLYLLWFEKTESSKSSDGTESFYTITAYSSYSDFTSNWSSPFKLSSIEQGPEETDWYDPLFDSQTILSTACLMNSSENKVYFTLYTYVNSQYIDFSLLIDYWLSVSVLLPINDATQGIVAVFDAYFDDKQQVVQGMFTSEGYDFISDATAVSGAAHNDFTGFTLALMTKSDLSLIHNSDDTLTLSGYISSTPNISTLLARTYTCDAEIDELGKSCSLTFSLRPSVYNKIYDIKLTGIPEEVSSTIYHYYVGPDEPHNRKHECDFRVPVNGVIDYTGKTFTLDTTVNESSPINIYFYGQVNYSGYTVDTYTAHLSSINSIPPHTMEFCIYSGDKVWGDGTLIFNSSNMDETRYLFTMDIPRPQSNSEIVYISYGYQRNDNKSMNDKYAITIGHEALSVPLTPSITVSKDTGSGSAVYLDFNDNLITDGKTYSRSVFSDEKEVSNIRLNTLFAKELINKASVSMQALLNWDTQLTQDPPMTTDGFGDTTPMDFSGANGLYFWELFFHMPHLVAWRLDQEQKYSDALDWYHYIFDPAARGRDNSSDIRKQYPEPDYWSVRPLVEVPSPSAQASAVWLTTDPDALASASPVHYQKAIFMAYVGTLMAAADASYRLLTNDGLSLARLQYGQVRDLLGPRPDSMIINRWVPESLEALAAGTGNSAALTGFEQQAPALPAFPGQASAADEATTSDAFMAPVNTQLLRYWNILDSRLYNLHHWLTIDGQPLNIPLYAPPVNPTLLMEQSVQGGALISTAAGGGVIVPPYRFAVMLQSARTAASILSQFGQTLLSYCERQDAAELQELDAQQLFNLSGYTLQLQQNAIDALDKDQAALGKSRDIAQGRQDHYQNLYNQNVSSGEITAMTLQDSSSASITAASPFITAGMAMRTIPNIFGLAVGGEDIGAPTIAAGMVLQLTGEILGIAARQTETSENYKRRREEWQIQYQQAQSEVGVINAQMEALAVRRIGAVTALNLATQQQANLKTTLNFLTIRFTQSALYNWLTGQLSALYYQAYDATLSLCLSAEACWQYEMGDITSRFIQTGTWNDNYRGLLVGETLQLNLQQMESAWLNRYTRRLELTKTVSLKNITDSAGTLQINWATFTTGAAAGTATFSLSESLFDKDYPGHYLRQIKSITVSLPALVGPYQDVRMTLTQSGSRVLLKPDINGVNYLNDPAKGSAASILTNPRASQQVAVSSGLNDAGLFVLNFGDERYLPFEGTGAVSDWQIAFPNPTSAEQKALLASLNDVIVQVHYTAVYGGSSFEHAVSVL